ncbi:hypothetical protein EYZ11_000338 [Aspergillus tanneri]|uniref:BTB domain-containing protein n=1 Tax=Aspergillus tanneri TaxID=1220188 RepID=A0A4S3JX94_9EURO|nr:hypothetical protein EYZ11_000338 [Aspergillus tanneri]
MTACKRRKLSPGAFSGREEYFNNPRFSDLTILSGDQKFYVHKVLVCAYSEYFSLLFDGDWNLYEDDPQAVKAMLQFMYGIGYMRGDDLLAASVYVVSDKYLVPKVKEHALEKFYLGMKYPVGLNSLPSVITRVYAMTTKIHQELRDIVVSVALDRIYTLWKNKEFVAVNDTISLQEMHECLAWGLLSNLPVLSSLWT